MNPQAAARLALILLVIVAGLCQAVAAVATAYATAAPSPRIEPLPEAQWAETVRGVFSRTRSGNVPSNDIKILAHYPERFESALPFMTYLSTGSTLAARDRELLMLRAAWLCRSSFVWCGSRKLHLNDTLGVVTLPPLRAR